MGVQDRVGLRRNTYDLEIRCPLNADLRAQLVAKRTAAVDAISGLPKVFKESVTWEYGATEDYQYYAVSFDVLEE